MFPIRMALMSTVLIAIYTGVMFALIFPLFGLVAFVIVVALACRKNVRLTSHGTARWAEPQDIVHLQSGSGIIIGHMVRCDSKWSGAKALFNRRLSSREAVEKCLYSFRRRRPPHLIQLSGAVHTAVFGPSGSGKNTSIVEPFLLTSSENAFVIDLKGENAQITAAYRARVFAHKIVIFDPWREVTRAPASLNVLDLVNPEEEECIDVARAFAEALVPKEPNSNQPHWPQKAEFFVTGAILAVAHFCEPDKRSLQEVAQILSDKTFLAETIKRLRASPAHDGLLARIGSEMSNPSDKELDGILSTANRALSFLSTPAVAESTRQTRGFAPADLDRAITGYFILPVKYMRSHAALMKLWCTAIMHMTVARGVGGPPVNMILDECAQLGQMEAIEDMLTIGRAYGIKITAIFQSMSQLSKVFPEGQEGVLLSNTTQIFFGARDQKTCEYISAMLGDSTEIFTSGGSSTSRSYQPSPQGGAYSHSTSSNSNWSPVARRLLQASEVAQLDPRVAITFHPGCPPIATYLTPYYENDFRPRHIGFARAIFDTLCLLLSVAILAVLLTASMLETPNKRTEPWQSQPVNFWIDSRPANNRK